MNKARVARTSLDRFPAIFMAFVFIISLLAITGWKFNLLILASLNRAYIPMSPASALIFMGLWVTWLIQSVFPAGRGIRIIVKACLLGILIMVLLLAIRSLTGLGPDLEKLIYPNPTLFGQIPTGRMSPQAALGFFLSIPAFLLLTGREPGRRTKSVSAALSLTLLVLSGLIILGYAYGAPLFYGGTTIPVALTTALSFLFLSLGLLIMAGPGCWPSRMFTGHSLRARLMRTFIPASIVIALFQGLLSTAAVPWITNPAVKVAVAALAACLIFLLIVSMLANNLSAGIERGEKAELALRESEERFRGLYETTTIGMYRTTPDGLILMGNPALVKMLGYESFEELSQRDLAKEDYEPEYSRRDFKTRIERDGEVRGLESAWERKDGSTIYVRESARLARNENNQPIYYEGTVEDITERKKAEEALRKSQSSLQAVLQSTADGILAVGSENEVLYANERFAEIWRIPQAVMASKDDSVLLQHILDQLGDPQGFLKKVQELYKSDEESFDTLDFKDGRIFERLSRPLMQGAEVRGRVWSFRDITERKRAAEALARSEEELRALFASMQDVVIVYDIDGRYIEIAPTNPTNLYRPPDEMLGKTMHEILPKEQADYNLSIIRDAIQTGKVINGEYTLQINGKERWFSASASRLSETTAIFVAHDSTARKQAEQELFKLSMAVDDSSDAIFMTNREGIITFVNTGFTKLYGYSAIEIVGKTTPRILKSGEMKAEDYEVFWQTLLNKQMINGEIINKTKDGRLLNIERSANPILNQQGEIIGFLSIQRDITQRKRFELVQDAIFRITQAAIMSRGIDALYHSIHSILGELIPAENFYISLYDAVKGSISFPYYVDQFDEPPPEPTPLQGLTGYVIRTGEPLLAPPELFDRLVQQGEVEVVGTTGLDWMGAPLKVEGRIIGVMAVQSYTEGINFNQKDLSLLEFVSSQVAQTIERKRLEEEIVSLSLTDELTGLYNRRGFTLLAEQEMKLARRFKRSVLLYFCDVDNLKTINDTLGHSEGDLAVKEMGAILKETFREADIPARFGGDEFVVLAPDASMEIGELIKKRLQATQERRNQEGARPYQLTFSMGVAHFDPETPCTISELITQADEQMYHQKKERKGN